MSDAQSAAADAAASFCEAGETYIVALDRYGDVLSSTAPTVGDVKDAGADLTEPGEDVTKEAEAAVEAHDELKAAEQELADARAELAEIRSSTDGPGSTARTTESEPTATEPPTPPAEVVNRVEHAESEFTAAQEGIADQTPLVQASQQFNAAAVALEMAWLSPVRSGRLPHRRPAAASRGGCRRLHADPSAVPVRSRLLPRAG